jgi:hypothetical protein
MGDDFQILPHGWSFVCISFGDFKVDIDGEPIGEAQAKFRQWATACERIVLFHNLFLDQIAFILKSSLQLILFYLLLR